MLNKVVLLLASLALIAAAVTGALVIPIFAEMFSAMNVELPLLTRLIVQLSPTLYLLLFIGSLAALLWLQKRLGDPARALKFNLAACLLAYVTLILLWVSLYLPMYSTIQSL